MGQRNYSRVAGYYLHDFNLGGIEKGDARPCDDSRCICSLLPCWDWEQQLATLKIILRTSPTTNEILRTIAKTLAMIAKISRLIRKTWPMTARTATKTRVI